MVRDGPLEISRHLRGDDDHPERLRSGTFDRGIQTDGVTVSAGETVTRADLADAGATAATYDASVEISDGVEEAATGEIVATTRERTDAIDELSARVDEMRNES